ncbi:hypothetical protein [Cellulosimicrobium composti]|uniref:Uncharacterized protein n=1 Tax=Cellulosimicrobium composti TaxID=2672572 RepID=A0ABX0BH89_9MICO|nr:hypothetical protein [Cellulosimicrobium composti]NDO91198.1 hypothetical protein [Cellulosimicrobium composti]TWG75802.1 hypothetical protein L603_000800001010 [Cellulosimicrobium cellulans J34]SMF30394.1 hypothetical protein SAMN02744115_02583 [Cellulosimicrobium cellulans J1]
MRFEGRPSWRLSVSDGGDLDLLLWVRDALRLVVPSDDVPPRCEPGTPDRSALVPAGERDAAASRWYGWWCSALAFEAAGRTEEPPSGEDAFLGWVRARSVARDGVGAPPAFSALGDVRVLRDAVARLFPEAHRTLAAREAGRAMALHRREAADDRRALAADVARSHGVGTGDVRGAVLVVAVAGPWWRVAAPGVVVCSASAYVDDAAFAAQVVRAAFESGLRA